MPQPIPSYLIALAVGDIGFQSMGPRTGVYAEPATLKAAAYEFAETETTLALCEKLFGPYRWGRYDLLVLPPSFPFGGMENPRLTFVTPTVITGDRRLVSLIAHELAHSWSGNLVTNATWEDFWLNEGFTEYLTYRLIEAQYGQARADMERVVGVAELMVELGEDRGGLLGESVHEAEPAEHLLRGLGRLGGRHIDPAQGIATFRALIAGNLGAAQRAAVATRGWRGRREVGEEGEGVSQHARPPCASPRPLPWPPRARRRCAGT